MPNLQIVITDPSRTNYQTNIQPGKYKFTLKDIYFETSSTVDQQVIISSEVIFNSYGQHRWICFPDYNHLKDNGNYFHRIEREFIVDLSNVGNIDIELISSNPNFSIMYINFNVEKIE